MPRRLSQRELQKPYLPARSGEFHWPPSMTRIESSFFAGRLEEMEDWQDAGVLARLMGRERKTTIAYHDLLPSRLLEGAVSRLLSPGYGTPQLTPQALQAWWEVLLQLRTRDQPRPISDWLHHAAVLPHPMADQWVEEGASPHAHTRDDRRSPSSPCLQLLRAVLPMRTQTHGTPGWPGVAERRQQLTRRLDRWIRMPGMTPDQATRALVILSLHATSRLASGNVSPAHEAWLEGLRDAVIAQGALCSNELIKDVFLPAIAPEREEFVHHRAAGHLVEARNQRERQRVASPHQARVGRWLGRVANLPCLDAVPWKSDTKVLSALLAMEGGDALLGAMFDHDPAACEGMVSGGMWFFRPSGKEREPASHTLRRVRNLASLRDHRQGPPEEWRIKVACEVIRGHITIAPEELEAWLECASTVEGKQEIADTWLRSLPFMSFGSQDALQRATSGLALLHERGLTTSFLPGSEMEEGSVEDLNAFREDNWHKWMADDRLASLLHALPSPFSERAATMQLFFIDDTVSDERMASLLARAVQVSPGLVGSALRERLQSLTDTAIQRRLPLAQRVVCALASAPGAVVPPTDIVPLWQEFAIRSAPRFRSQSADMEVLLRLAEGLNTLAPVAKAEGEPMRQWCKEEKRQEREGYLQSDATLPGRWRAMDQVLDVLDGWGGDFSRARPDPALPLGELLTARQTQSTLDASTPQPAPRARPRF